MGRAGTPVDDGVSRDIRDHRRAGTHHCPLADRPSRRDGGADADERAVADDHASGQQRTRGEMGEGADRALVVDARTGVDDRAVGESAAALMTAPGITSTPAPSPAEGETIDRGLTADTIVAPAAWAVALTARRVRLSPMATKTPLPLAAAEANQSSVRPSMCSPTRSMSALALPSALTHPARAKPAAVSTSAQTRACPPAPITVTAVDGRDVVCVMAPHRNIPAANIRRRTEPIASGRDVNVDRTNDCVDRTGGGPLGHGAAGKGNRRLWRFGDAVRRRLPQVQYALDAPCWLIAVAVMTLLRYDMHVDRINPGGVLAVGVAAAILQGLVGLPFGLYRRRFHYGSFDEVRVLACVVGVTTVVLMVVVAIFGGTVVPRSVPVLAGFAALVMTSIVRYVARLFEEQLLRPDEHSSDAVLVYGAGRTGTQLVHSMLTTPSSPFRPVALLDDDPLRQAAADPRPTRRRRRGRRADDGPPVRRHVAGGR